MPCPLDKINSPSDLKSLSTAQLVQLSTEIRELMIETVSRNGGHLASSLGAVELTLAVHFVFNAPFDKLLWDVGHQAYVHKILTGRRDFFKTLRMDDGCLGFLSRDESPYDAFGAGHAGTAISAALGMAAARDRRGTEEKVVAIVGDGSLNCGISLEGLNNVAETTKDFIIILNDNKMSIGANVGAIPKYLNSMISGRGYNRFKAVCKTMLRKIPHGAEIHRKISKVEEAMKSLFVPGVIFEELGLRYIGPIDGHNLPELIWTLNAVKEFRRPVLLHVITEKGRGYPFAEKAPEKFHGLSSFDRHTGQSQPSRGKTFSCAFGETLQELAEKDSRIIAITAAMASGTGLQNFAQRLPQQFFDVGIAEEHAVVFAAGLATEGLRPVVALYATFLQRSLDYLFHDICLQNLPVLFALDRAGIVDDGPTHHGIFDLGFLCGMPNLSILFPATEQELRTMLYTIMTTWSHPVVIRYPRGSTSELYDSQAIPQLIPWGSAQVEEEGDENAPIIWALGRELHTARQVADLLQQRGLKRCTLVNVRFLMPLDTELLLHHAAKADLITLEDNLKQGGLATAVAQALSDQPHRRLLHFGWDRDQIPPHGTCQGIRARMGMDPLSLADAIESGLRQPSQIFPGAEG